MRIRSGASSVFRSIWRCGLEFWLGLLMTVLAAFANGNFTLPMKGARKWRWENFWALYSLVAFCLVPGFLALLTIPDLIKVYSSVPGWQIAKPMLFGAGWGVSQVLLGISVARVGMALTFAIVIGLSAVLGTLIPLVSRESGTLLSVKGALVIGGMGIMLAGIYLCAKAGRRREGVLAAKPSRAPVGGYRKAVAVTVAAGILTPMLNYALAFGGPIVKRAVEQGASPGNATYAVWVVTLLGGLPINLGYAVYLLNRNRTWAAFSARTYDWAAAVLMGILWMGSIALYGVATTHLGPSGAAIGWGLFSIFVILAANLSGLVTGEWRGVGAGPLGNLATGLGLLTVASAVLAMGNHC
jgi:L-rhamnose-H+ transport protein